MIELGLDKIDFAVNAATFHRNFPLLPGDFNLDLFDAAFCDETVDSGSRVSRAPVP